MIHRSALAALLFTLPGMAWAIPGQLSHQGRLMDSSDVPIEGEHTLMFTIYDSEDGGAVLWQETLDVEFSNGYYSTTLGADEEGDPLDTDVLGQHPVFLGMAVDGGDDLEPRHEILSVPYAVMADTCENVSGGIVDASEIRLDGEPVITEGGAWTGATPSVDWTDLSGIPDGFADGVDDDTVLDESAVDEMVSDNGYALASDLFSGGFGDLSGIPSGLEDGDDDTLAVTSCEDGEILVFNFDDTTWTCGEDTDTTLSAEEVQGMVETFVADTPIELAEGRTIGGAAIPSGEAVPAGVIVMWSGTDVPDGWALCDGEDGTPDLRDRFVVGSGTAHETGDIGSGTSTLSVGTSRYADLHGCTSFSSSCTTIVTSVSGGGGTPSFYAVAYIMKL